MAHSTLPEKYHDISRLVTRYMQIFLQIIVAICPTTDTKRQTTCCLEPIIKEIFFKIFLQLHRIRNGHATNLIMAYINCRLSV